MKHEDRYQVLEVTHRDLSVDYRVIYYWRFFFGLIWIWGYLTDEDGDPKYFETEEKARREIQSWILQTKKKESKKILKERIIE